MAKNYKDLDIYKASFDLFIKTHRFSARLPKQERFELGSQLRRSSDSIVSNIVEGYGRKKYKSDFLKHLIYAKASNDETICHLEKIKILYPDLAIPADYLINENNLLGAKIHSFMNYVQKYWKT